MTTTTVPALRREAQALGCAVEVRMFGTARGEIILTAPAGKRFADLEVHETIASFTGTIDDRQADAVRLALRDLRGGIEECDDPECEWCAE